MWITVFFFGYCYAFPFKWVSNIYFSFLNKYIIDIFLRNYPSIRHKRWENGGKKKTKKKENWDVKTSFYHIISMRLLNCQLPLENGCLQFSSCTSQKVGGKKKRNEENVTKIGPVFQAKADHLEKYFIYHLPK